ncbi:MAG: PEGA domain-containing protein [Candidatus Omnitrophica bacterium]|nr:PEGA domain-containing protein [Candidatus Omnitrophota bacterium]
MKLANIRGIACLFLLVFVFAGCATFAGKDVFPLRINSNPEGANIIVKDENGDSVFSGTTPTTVTLNAGESYFHAKSYNITFSKQGYAEQYVEVKASLSGWYFGNILFGGLIGMLIVDPITGKMWKLPTNVTANLSQKTSLNQGQSTLKIMTLNQVPEHLKKYLVRIK